MKYLACSDLHLGAGADLGRVDGERLEEQEQVLDQVVDLAIERRVDALLFAGDAFEGPHVTPEQYAAFQRPLRRLDVPVVAITGNGRHDAAMRAVKAPEVVADVADVHTVPDVIRLPGDVMLAVLPWTPVSRLVAAQDGGDRDEINANAAELLVRAAHDLAADCRHVEPGWPRILMTHFAISGDKDGISEFAREPVLPLAELEQLDFDVIVAGHYHRGQLLSSVFGEPVMPIIYCGSPMPLNFGEGGYEHGVWILESHEAAPGVTAFAPEFVPLASRPFVTLDWDASEVEGLHDLDPIVGWSPGFDPGSFVKLRYSASEADERSFDHARMRQVLVERFGAYRVWIEPTVERARRDRGVEFVDGQSRAEQLAAYLDATGVNGDVKPAMLEAAGRYIG